MAPIEEELKSTQYDGVIIGFGVRGTGDLPTTIHFESMFFP